MAKQDAKSRRSKSDSNSTASSNGGSTRTRRSGRRSSARPHDQKAAENAPKGTVPEREYKDYTLLHPGSISDSDERLAVDHAIPEGFEKRWPEFAKLLWNQDPVDGSSFKMWDDLVGTPDLAGQGAVVLDASGGMIQKLPSNLPHLAIRYEGPRGPLAPAPRTCAPAPSRSVLP